MTEPTTDEAAGVVPAATDPPAALVEMCAQALAAANFDDDPTPNDRHDARVVLAALFAVSEIRVQYGYRYLAGGWPDQWPGPRVLAEGAVRNRSGAAVLLRRIVLTLPAETIPETTGNIDGGQ